MKTFVNNTGQTWVLAINVASVKRIKGLLGIDLFQLADDGLKGLVDLINNPISFADVLFVLCMDQAKERNVTDEDFGRALAGDCIEQAADAFVQELIDFFPNPRVRKALGEVIQKGKVVQTRLLEHGEKMLSGVDAEAEAQKFIDSFTKSRASSASILTPSLSGN